MRKISLASILGLVLCTSSVFAAEPPVTQQKFNKLVEIMKRMNQRINELEKQKETQALNPPASDLPPAKVDLPAASDKVNLDDMDSAAASTGKSDAAKNSALLKVYFDLNLYMQPGGSSGGSDFTFDNFHSLVLLDFVPNEDIHFSTEISATPRFYELDYKAFEGFTLRFGKIWIPFDDMNPHNIFGGRTNVSRITVGDSFLPDLFTDLGVGLQMDLFDTEALRLRLDAYAVNGFQPGGTDPVTSTSAYPKFGPDLTIGADNNTDKGLGGRAHFLFGKFIGLGASYYTAVWTNRPDPRKRLTMYGADSQLYLTSTTTIRGGIAAMNVQLPSTSPQSKTRRGGSYIELGQKFGSEDHWKVIGRAGVLNLDSRLIDRNDRRIVGGALLFKPGLIEWSVEHSRDLKETYDKRQYHFTNFRMIASF